MASPGGILTRIRSFMQQPTMKKAVKTIFPDPMDKFKWQDVLWDFRNKEALEEWTLVTDEQFGGKSTAEFVQSPGGRAIFKGHISTELPPASDVKYTGMCSIRAQPKWVSYTLYLILLVGNIQCSPHGLKWTLGTFEAWEFEKTNTP